MKKHHNRKNPHPGNDPLWLVHKHAYIRRLHDPEECQQMRNTEAKCYQVPIRQFSEIVLHLVGDGDRNVGIERLCAFYVKRAENLETAGREQAQDPLCGDVEMPECDDPIKREYLRILCSRKTREQLRMSPDECRRQVRMRQLEDVVLKLAGGGNRRLGLEYLTEFYLAQSTDWLSNAKGK